MKRKNIYSTALAFWLFAHGSCTAFADNVCESRNEARDYQLVVDNTMSNTVEADSVAISADNFPDSKFRAYVKENFDTNQDGSLDSSEIGNVTSVGVSGTSTVSGGITSVKGIEYFSELLILNVYGNSISEIDLSHNTKLQIVDVAYNELSELDVSANTQLRLLYCYNNELTTLDISKNTLLETIGCDDNKLTSLDLSNNSALTELSVCRNELTTLNLSNLTELINLYCGSNSLTELDLSNNDKLVEVDCSDNPISALVVDDLAELKKLSCNNMSITKIDLSQNTNLEQLWIHENFITELNLANNTKLSYLNCSETNIDELDISQHTALTELYCNCCNLTELDVSNNTLLRNIYCRENSLSTLDLSNNTALVQLMCESNSLSALNVSNNPLLEVLYITSNDITSINLSNNAALLTFRGDYCPLAAIDVSNNPSLEFLCINSTNITSIDLSKNPKVSQLVTDKQIVIYGLAGCYAEEYADAKGITFICTDRPGNVKTTAGDRSVQLTWNKVDGATNYAVLMRKGDSWVTLGATGTNTGYTATNLVNGGKYFFTVKAYANGKWSGASKIVACCPYGTEPQNVKAIGGDSKATITWDSVEGATNYAVLMRKGSQWVTLGATGTNTTYTARNLVNGGKYFFAVRAYVDGKWSSYSEIVTAFPVSTVPKNVIATGGVGSATITWDSVDGATNYAVLMRKGTSWITLGATGTNTTYTASNLVSGGKYFFVVKAYANGAWSDASATVFAIPQ